MRLPAPAVWLAMIALTFAGCDQATSASAGAAYGAPAVRSGSMAAGAPGYARPKNGEMRGELLYSAYCIACHTAEIHWRDKRLVIGMRSLVFQVRRWQSSMGLNWTEGDIADVVRYMNTAYYGFPDIDQEGLRKRRKSPPAMGRN